MKKPIQTMLIFTIFMLISACTPAATNQPVSIPSSTAKPTEPTLAPTQPLAPTQAPVREILDNKTEKNLQDPGVDFVFQFPSMTEIDTVAANFNLAVNQLINQEEKYYQNLLVEIPPTTEESLGNVNSSFSSTYNIIHLNPTLVSIHFIFDEYIAGAAHPNNYTRVINYDILNAKTIALSDIFLPNSNYLEVLSQYCSQELSQRGYFDFPEGAEPIEDNYHGWNISPKGLIIHFDPYQVAPYAVGRQQVLVPYTALQSILKADGPLGSYKE